MDQDLGKAKRDHRRLVKTQRLAALATQSRGQAYASLIAFASSEDLKSIYFATNRSTRKYANLSSSTNVALLLDNRANKPSDFRWAMAATATGRVKEVASGKREHALALYVAKHPHLKDFVHSPTCALCEITVRTYYLVTHFQNVVEVQVRP